MFLAKKRKDLVNNADSLKPRDKAELDFWKKHLNNFNAFYLKQEYLENLRQEYFNVYCYYLKLNKDSFKDKVLVDIGCGPHGASGLFKARKKIGVDILSNRYKKEFDLSWHDMEYLDCQSENIQLADNFADVAISRNALDFVDDFVKTIQEIHRILKKGGEIRLSINLRENSDVCGTHILNEKVIKDALDKKFRYEIIERFPKFSREYYSFEIITVKGTKI